MKATTRPRVQLTWQDGNAWFILGRCKRAAKLAGWTDEQWTAFSEEAKSGDYDHLLDTVCEHFDADDEEADE